MYKLTQAGHYYAIVYDDGPVRSPLGRPYLTGFQPLAEDLCEDLNRFGPSGSGATLHAVYLDHGRSVSQTRWESWLLMRYHPALDFALDRPQDRTAAAMMTAWFGPVTPPERLSAWLRAASLRELVSMVVATDVARSVLVAHRLLRGELPATRLAAGLCKWERAAASAVAELTLTLDNIRRYAQAPDEPELIAATPLELEARVKGASLRC
jgi:hypothetical protein